MTEQEYKELRERTEIPMKVWYDYFLERGGSDIGLGSFENYFTKMLLGVAISKSGKVLYVNLQTALQSFYKHYNEKFGL